MASAIRSSCWTRAPTYNTEAGTLARSDSTTGLRPATNSAASPPPRGARDRSAPGPRAAAGPQGDAELSAPAEARGEDPADAAAARRWAGWPGRWAAGGVGPLPSSARRPCPPVPGRGLPVLVLPLPRSDLEDPFDDPLDPPPPRPEREPL